MRFTPNKNRYFAALFCGLLAASGSAAAKDQNWWEQFEDPTLTSLVEEGMSHQGDIRAALHQEDAAVASSHAAFAPLLPTLGIESSGTAIPFTSLFFKSGTTLPIRPPQQLPPSIPFVPPPLLAYTGSATLNAGLRTDFGRSYFNFVASQNDARAAHQDRISIRRTVATKIIEAYFDIVTAKDQLRILEEQIAINTSLLSLTQERFASGEGNALDVLQQRQQLSAIKTQLPGSRAQLQALAAQLTALLARDTPVEVGPLPGTLPTFHPLEDLVVDDALVARQPQVRSAMKRLAAAQSRKKGALFAFMPTAGINGQVGTQAIKAFSTKAQSFWSASAQISIPLFSGGATFAGLQRANALAAAQAAKLDQLKRTTYQSARSTLLQEDGLHQQLQAAQTQLTDAKLAAKESKSRYAAGLANYQALLSSTNGALIAEISVLATKRRLFSSHLRVLNTFGIHTSGGSK